MRVDSDFVVRYDRGSCTFSSERIRFKEATDAYGPWWLRNRRPCIPLRFVGLDDIGVRAGPSCAAADFVLKQDRGASPSAERKPEIWLTAQMRLEADCR